MSVLQPVLDETDRRLIAALVTDARLSLKDLALAIGLSAPATSERLRRLELRGIVTGYSVSLNAKAIGYPLQAIVRVRPLPGNLYIVERLIRDIPEVAECDKVTGDDCFIVRLYVASIEALDQLLDGLAEKAETNTSIVKAQPVARRPPPF
jgi:Lrp/AsnC family transcriptional regulator, leucine-responsive regulatory protein